MTPLVMTLVRSQRFSAAEVEELYTFLRKQRRSNPPGNPK